MFAPATVVRDGGANKAFGSIDQVCVSYRHFFVDATA
jgi:hypothetical protein